jgi:hypothetical protein
MSNFTDRILEKIDTFASRVIDKNTILEEIASAIFPQTTAQAICWYCYSDTCVSCCGQCAPKHCVHRWKVDQCFGGMPVCDIQNNCGYLSCQNPAC